MKKILIVCAAVSMLFFMVAMAAAGDTTVNGTISDSMCGAKGASADHAACMTKCMGKGAKAVLVTDTDQKVVAIDNPDAIKGHEGHHVSVTGEMSGNSIHVDSIKML